MRYKPAVLATALGAAVAVALAGCGNSAAPAANPGAGATGGSAGTANTVTTTLLSFVPATITVKTGTTVTWHAGDGIAHTVTTGTYQVGAGGLRTSEKPDGRLDKPLVQGTDVSHTFGTPGTYTYFCSIHKGMNGTVVVTP